MSHTIEMKSKRRVSWKPGTSVGDRFYLKRIWFVGMQNIGLASYIYYLNNYRTDLQLFQRQSLVAAGCGYVLSELFSFIYASSRIRNKDLIRAGIGNIAFFLPAYFAISSSKFPQKTNKIINYTCLGLSIVGHLYKIYTNRFVGDILYLSAWSALARDYKPLLFSVLSIYAQNIFMNKKHNKIADQQLPALQEKVRKKEERHRFNPKHNDLLCMGRRMTTIRGLCKGKNLIDDADKKEKDIILDERLIKNVCLIVVVDAEIRPIMEQYKFAENTELSAKLMNLGIVSSGRVKNLNIDIIKVAESKVFKRHYSGYTQASALAALVSSIIKPDIVISFGTAGGITFISKSQYHLGGKSAFFGEDDNESCSDDEESSDDDDDAVADEVEIGDVVLGEACLFLDRLRTRNQNAFDWGVWGGSSIQTNNLVKDLGLVKGIIGSQIGYMVSEFQSELIGNANIIALDMECASIAQILNQTETNFLALKVISNGIYPKNPGKMESEYHDNREMVSKKATEVLVKVIDYLNDKRINEL